MDTDLIDAKLESLARCMERLASKTPPSLEKLRDDLDAQDILSVNLERAVQLCVDIGLHMISTRSAPLPATMAGTFECLLAEGLLSDSTARALVGAVGFRNVSVHAYQSVDWSIVWSILQEDADAFRRFAPEVIVALNKDDFE